MLRRGLNSTGSGVGQFVDHINIMIKTFRFHERDFLHQLGDCQPCKSKMAAHGSKLAKMLQVIVNE